MILKSFSGVILGATFFNTYDATINFRKRLLKFPDFIIEFNHIYQQETKKRVNTKHRYQSFIVEDATVEA